MCQFMMIIKIFNKNPNAKIYMATTKAHKVYTEVEFESEAYIMFGKKVQVFQNPY